MKKHTQSPYESSKVSYKPSGIEWLGEIPKHWEICKLNKVSYFINGYAFESSHFDYSFSIPVIRIGDIQNDKIIYHTCLMTKEQENLKNFMIYRGDIVIALSGATTGKFAVCNSNKKAYINQRVAIIRSDIKILKYYLSTFGFVNYIDMLCNGSAQPNISTKEVGNFKIPLPPLQEQKEIAEFLDSKCEKIQNYIEKKQKLITLLQEKKQALINEAATKGLNPNIESKNSGIEYLGLIPHHWEVRRVATLGKFFKGSNISKNDLQDSGVSVVLYGDIYTKYEIKTKQFQSKIAENFAKDKTQILCGDLLFSGSGETKEDIGKCICYLGNEKAYVGGDVIVLRQMGQDSLFLSYVLNSDYIKYQKAVISKGEIIIHIYASNLRDLKIPLPPLQEQKEIAAFLDSKVAQIDSVIEKTKKQIELIKEYKNTLINEAVCGRIRLN
ncbi:restriction endonuclease subunit S [Helicobacter bilis]|uniref:restriction endonuclease subunit S n=1 Tax=Helicobacter bilis TaxID=37372 RepID=UPI00248DED96|nr:restriction endonuclease subunit S [Helicobacter bilis]